MGTSSPPRSQGSGDPGGPVRPSATYPRRPTTTGPRGNVLLGSIREYGADPLAAMRRWRDDYGDLVPLRFGPLRIRMAFGPIEVSEVLATRAKDFRKSLGVRILSHVLGRGLLTDEGESWLRSRRLIAPAFSRDRVAGYDHTILAATDAQLDRWHDGDALDIGAEMSALTLRVIARVLFDTDITPRVEEIARLGASVQDHYFDRLNSLRFLLPSWLPTPGNRRLRRDAERFDAIVDELIGERAREDDRGDLLSMLLRAQGDAGPALSRGQVRDHVVTLLLAGHETTALALTWAWLLLAQHPATRASLEAELDTVLDGQPPTAGHLPRLRYTEAVINETLRLRPPVYATGREALGDTTIGGMRIARSEAVFVSMSATHRDPRFFEDPDEFRPERWLDGLAAELPRGAFFPFGLGPRMCVGASFAMLEATLILARCAQHWRFDADVSGVAARPAITLRPDRSVRGTLRIRRTG